ncbi:DUF4097 family beta strand repeat-containing protein [Pseudonocardia zijingensis]|uniref:DUF4097 family beta strand repeat-containing protein n=1 Tax=Pseudonocardia zijingensis TaxID=153376 RepID=A0ABP3YVW8_9PSEU
MPTFATPDPITLTLTLTAADIRLRASERTDTVVTVAPRDPANAKDVELAERTRTDFADDRLEIRAPQPWRVLGPSRNAGALDVEIELPTGSEVHGEAWIADLHATGELGRVEFSTSLGDLTVDRTGPAKLATNSRVTARRIGGTAEIKSAGAVRIDEIGGPTTIKNLNGATEVGRVEAELTCRSANGDVSVGTALADVKATTSNGAIRVEEVVRGDISLKTANGHVEIGIRPGTAARLDVHTKFGRVRNGLDATDGPGDSDEVATISTRTSVGDIVIRRPESGAVR